MSKVLSSWIVTSSLLPSKLILPPPFELYVAPSKVPLFSFPERSYQTVPVSGYDDVLLASKYKTTSSVTIFGTSSVVLFVCVVDTVSPEAEKIVFDTGKTVKTSLPSGVPESEIPRPIVVPLILILEGVAEDKEAEPLDIDNTKSDTSRVDVTFAVPP